MPSAYNTWRVEHDLAAPDGPPTQAERDRDDAVCRYCNEGLQMADCLADVRSLECSLTGRTGQPVVCFLMLDVRVRT
ncbi:MAG TPA: hypothetical protein DCP69_04250 [Candidatus Omnitrophica bacterium]|nr:hypothetical protein [Candidatus Omnitrophota bacterium]